ncbi:MAG: HAD family hydrolase [Candidatus Omnitrophota bacterium]
MDREKISKKKMFIFDLDGTLINAYPAIVESMNYTLRQMNYPPSEPEKIIRAVGLGNDGLFRVFLREEDISQARDIYRQHHKTHLKGKISLLPGALDLLKRLKSSGKILSVASNRPAETALLLISVLEITSYFDRVLTGEEVTNPKPAPDILLALLSHFRILPEDALYVGDMTIDAQTGASAGIETVIVTTGSSTPEEVKAADPYLIITSLLEFPI